MRTSDGMLPSPAAAAAPAAAPVLPPPLTTPRVLLFRSTVLVSRGAECLRVRSRRPQLTLR